MIELPRSWSESVCVLFSVIICEAMRGELVNRWVEIVCLSRLALRPSSHAHTLTHTPAPPPPLLPCSALRHEYRLYIYIFFYQNLISSAISYMGLFCLLEKMFLRSQNMFVFWTRLTSLKRPETRIHLSFLAACRQKLNKTREQA